MLVAEAVRLLQEMPQHLELLLDCSRNGDKGFLFKSPENIDVAQNPFDENQEFVLIGAFGETPQFDNDN
jgi:hypothetical protein